MNGKRKNFALRTGVFGVAAAAALAVTACAQAPATGAQSSAQSAVQSAPAADTGRTIIVNSSETVKAVPDKAVIDFSVVSDGENAAACREQNAQDVNAVVEYLKGQSIPDESIQTSDMGMYPRYDWNSGNGNNIVGYEMTTSITVQDVSLDQLSNILTSSVDAGINSISGITYQASTYDAAYQEALSKAIEAAKLKAEAMAKTAGVTLGGVVNIEEIPSSTDGSRYESRSLMTAETADAAAGTNASIMPGTVDAQADVQVEFSIK